MLKSTSFLFKNAFFRGFIILSALLFLECSSNKSIVIEAPTVTSIRKISLTQEQQNNWQHKDIILDTVPGISLDRAYQEIIKNKKGKEVIVAVIDTELDIEHEDLKNTIWTNPKEIPYNGLDDDQNGYTDDIHGWNFLGNKKGENVLYANMESTRIIRKFQREFDGKTEADIPENKLHDFVLYERSLKKYAKAEKDLQENLKYITNLPIGLDKAKKAIHDFFPDEKYEKRKLDSLYKAYKDTDKQLAKNFFYVLDCINVTDEWVLNFKKDIEEKLSKCMGINYDERAIMGDNPEDISDKKYGNNSISGNAKTLYHATEVVGILAANRENEIGIKGFSNAIRIMSLPISAYGDENDKDIALAIYYAVDNGAKVINMSFGKLLSMRQDWILAAIKYAAEKDVLLVSSAGNGGMEVTTENTYYPNNRDNNNKEISSNFIKVGATTSSCDEKLVAPFSNYSKEFVDIFAPGSKIYTSFPDNTYKFDNGTSLSAPIVSGIAALIRSHYPKLTAAQVKQIILDSGVSYDFEVQVPGEKKGVTKPFKELSKSGKVVNAYNALLMAEQVSKGKKKL